MDDSSIISLPNKIEMQEPSLTGVKLEDRTTVRNIIYLLHACKHPERLCSSWSVQNTRTGYEITGLLQKDFKVLHENLDFIKLADPLRIMSIAISNPGDVPQIVISLLSKTEPIMLTELAICMQKKRKFWSKDE